MNFLLTVIAVAVLAILAYQNPLVQQRLYPSSKWALKVERDLQTASEKMFKFAQENPLLYEFPADKIPIPKEATDQDREFLTMIHKELTHSPPVAWLGKDNNVKIESISDLSHIIMGHYVFYATVGGGATRTQLMTLLDMFVEFYDGIDQNGAIFPDVIGFVNVLNVMEKVNYPSTKLAAHYVAKTDIYLNAELFIQSPVRTWIMSALMNFSPPIDRKKHLMPKVGSVSSYNKEAITKEIGSFLHNETAHGDPATFMAYQANLKLFTSDILATVAAWGQPKWLEALNLHILPIIGSKADFDHIKMVLTESMVLYLEEVDLKDPANYVQAAEVLIACHAIDCYETQKEAEDLVELSKSLITMYPDLGLPNWKEGEDPNLIANSRLPRVMAAWSILAKYRIL